MVFSSSLASAQSGFLHGRIVDEKASPVRFDNVGLLLMANSAAPIAQTITDSTGQFRLASPEAGNYILQATAIGFAKAQTDSFTVSGVDYSKDFGNITIRSDVKKLENVTITSLRPTIVQKADRMVVTVEGTAMAAGSNAYAVLSKSPGVFIDAEGNIQLNGRSGTGVVR